VRVMIIVSFLLVTDAFSARDTSCTRTLAGGSYAGSSEETASTELFSVIRTTAHALRDKRHATRAENLHVVSRDERDFSLHAVGRRSSRKCNLKLAGKPRQRRTLQC